MCTENDKTEQCPKSDDEWTRSLQLFEIHRDYIKHENELVNHRVTMMIALNSLLFASVSIILSSEGLSPDIVLGFVFLMALSGAAGTVFSGISAFAAFRAMIRIKENWEGNRTCFLENSSALPGIFAGGGTWAARFGQLGLAVTAITLAIVWTIVAVASWNRQIFGVAF